MMKKLLVSLVTVALLLSSLFAVSAIKDKNGVEISFDNAITTENFPETAGYTDYWIFKNDNVKFYYSWAGEVKEVKYNYDSIDTIANAAMLGDCRSAIQLFRNGNIGNAYFYEGTKVALLTEGGNAAGGIVEIKFHGTAINLINCYLSNQTEAAGMGAKIVVDGKEYTVGSDVFTPVTNDIAGRSVLKRWFTLDNLANGWHTVTIYSTGSQRLSFDAYEVKETTPPPQTTPGKDKNGTEISATNMLTSANFANTEGFTDYWVLKNDNVKFYGLKNGERIHLDYGYASVDTYANAGWLADAPYYVQVFRNAPNTPNPWFYEGTKVALLSGAEGGVCEIKFHGTAINLINCYLSNPTEGAGISAKVVVDGTEYTVGPEAFTPVTNDMAGRSVFKRWFAIDNLSDDWHTVTIYSTGSQRLSFDAYEIKETTPTPTLYTVTVPNGVTASATEVEAGATVTLTKPAVDTGYAFGAWSVVDAAGADVAVTNDSFTMPASDVTVTYTTSKINYTISDEKNVADKDTANYGDTVTLTVPQMETGKEFAGWIVTDASGAAVTVTNNTFTMPASNVTVTYSTDKTLYTVTDEKNVADKDTANYGDTVTLTVPQMETGYAFGAWVVTDASGVAVTVANNAFVMPASNVTVTYTTTKIAYTVTDEKNVADKDTANYGDTVTLTVPELEADKEFVAWVVTDASGAAVTVTDNAFTMPASNVTVSYTTKDVVVPPNGDMHPILLLLPLVLLPVLFLAFRRKVENA